MTTTRRRRIVRRAVLVSALLILAIVSRSILREPPEIQRSRGIKLGMTVDEVTVVMGDPSFFLHGGNYSDLLFGDAVRKRLHFWHSIRQLPISKAMAPKIEEWPVRVHFDQNGRVDRIVRGGVTEESTEDATTAAQKKRRLHK